MIDQTQKDISVGVKERQQSISSSTNTTADGISPQEIVVDNDDIQDKQHDGHQTIASSDSIATTLEKESNSQTSTTTTPSSNDEGQLNTTPSQDPSYITGKSLILLSAALIVLALLILIDVAILAPALAKVTDQFHTIEDIGWYTAAYSISNATFQPMSGKFFTYFSLKPAFMAFVGVFEIGSIICATSVSSKMLIIGRAICGVGGAGMLNGSLTIIGKVAPPKSKPLLMGVVMAFASVGQLVGPLMGGGLAEHASWRWCFWINLPTGVACTALIFLVRFPHLELPKPSLKTLIRDFDIIGFVIFAPACIMLLLALQWGGVQYAWSSSVVIGLICGSVAAAIIFAFWERRAGDHAMIPPSILRIKIVSFSCLTSAFQNGGAIITAYYLPVWLQVVKHYGPEGSAINTLPTFIASILAAIVAGVLTMKLRMFTPLAILGGVATAVGSGLMATFTVDTKPTAWIGFQILIGAGKGICMQQPIQAVQAAIPISKISAGSALVSFCQFFGMATCVSIAQAAFQNFLRSAIHQYAPNVDPSAVVSAGATEFYTSVPLQYQQEVLISYNHAITRVFLIAVGALGIGTLTSMGMGWKKVDMGKTKKNALAAAEKA